MAGRYLITGGAGFIGSHLADALLARGDSVTVLDDLSTGRPENLAAASASDRLTFVQGSVLDRAEIVRQIELFRTRTATERRSIVGLQPQRAEVILAGACIVRTVLDKLGTESLTVSDRGLRYGVLAERFG